MTSVAHHPAAFAVHVDRDPRLRDESDGRLYLRATGDGWSLLNPAGEVLFRGFGLAGRRQCLEFARANGVLAVLA
jgi:hypothetical protein